MTEATLDSLRRQKDEFFRHSPHAPLTPAQRAAFDGLRYYPYDPTLDLILPIERFGDAVQPLPIETTTGDTRYYLPYGRIHFEAEGQTVSLTLYETEHGLFLPFVDANKGTETYPAGRYLDLELLPGDRVHVDFNLAYNPYCAYGPQWSCPITPPENRLTVAIRAGEMLPGAWAEGV
jgi:hypothetical protein